MSQLIINTNRGTADTLKSGATKINSNFTELYSILATDQISIPSLLGNSGKYLTTNGTSVIWQTFQVPDAVVTTGTYTNPSWIATLDYSKLTNRPNLANYLTAVSLSVSTITPSGNGALTYSSGVFTYTPPNLATVATSGSYADLTNKPTITAIPTQTANSGKYLTTDGTTLSWAIVTGGTTDYNNLTNKPTIPAAQVQSDWTAVSGLGVVLNKPSLFSGSYTDLTNKPTIPAAYSATSINALSDVDTVTTTPTAGQPLVWNAVSSNWVPGSVVSGSLSTLSGVTITSPAVGQVLKYNGSSWINDADSVSGGAGVGTVTTVSVTSANGFTGTVATASSTPAITITTSITGVLKGNGTAILAATSGTDYAPGTSSLSTGIVKSTTTTGALSIAVAGTDYQAPIGTITGLVKGNGANALTAAVAGTDYQSAQSVTGIVKSSGTTRSAATSGTDYAPGTSALATGIVKSTTTTGALSIAVAGTDYQAPVSATGILKSNGTSGNVSAATAGTDYQAPIGTISGLVKGNGANTLTAAVAGTDYQSAQSVNGIVKSSGTTRSAAVAGTDYIAPYSSQTANTHLAAPSGAAGAPTFRLLTAADIPGTLGTTAHSGTVTLNGSANLVFTGSTSGTVTFVAGTAPANQSYTLPSAYPGVTGYVLASTTLGVLSWVGAATGTVTSASVASANGFAGTVATSTSTPAITITTSITGVLKGNGTAISAAVSGTDYQAPIGTISGLVKGNGANALTAAVSGTDYQAPIGTISGLVKGNGANALTAATANIDYQSAQSVTGIVKSTGTSRSAAVAGTDYQAPISLTTTGSSGPATFSSNVLNIPQYSGGASSFSALSDASSASLTIDKIYLPAITMLAVTANGSTAYRFDQYGTADDPTIYAISGTTIAFNLSVSGHPFLIRTSGSVNYDTGLVHVSTTGVVSTGTSAQGQVTGTLYWKIPASTTGNYQYVCSIHGGMVGVITIKDISVI